MDGSSASGSLEPSNYYGTHFRVFFYRGPDAVVEHQDWFDDSDLPRTMSLAESLAGDDALWSLAVVLAGPDGESMVWLVGMNYLRNPVTSVERYRRRDMEQQFLLKRSLAGQTVPTLPDGRRVIRMFCDYGVSHPLWENHTKHYPALPEHFSLSEELGEALRQWQWQWEQGAVSQRDCPAVDSERWVLQGDELAGRLEREVGPQFMVRREYRMHWPPDRSDP